MQSKRDIMFHSQLHERVKILSDVLEFHIISLETKIDGIRDAIFEKDPLYIGITASSDFVYLLDIGNSSAETYSNYKGCCSAGLKRLSSKRSLG